jgi:hypothetical protein
MLQAILTNNRNQQLIQICIIIILQALGRWMKYRMKYRINKS